jgi:hypothetical protein
MRAKHKNRFLKPILILILDTFKLQSGSNISVIFLEFLRITLFVLINIGSNPRHVKIDFLD